MIKRPRNFLWNHSQTNPHLNNYHQKLESQDATPNETPQITPGAPFQTPEESIQIPMMTPVQTPVINPVPIPGEPSDETEEVNFEFETSIPKYCLSNAESCDYCTNGPNEHYIPFPLYTTGQLKAYIWSLSRMG